MGIRRKSRETAMQFLFQEEFFPDGVRLQDDLEARFERFCILYPIQKLARPYAIELLQGTMHHLDRIDTLIRESASNWRIERIALTDRNLLRIAVYEMLFSEDAPDQVVINEAVEIAKRYGTEESAPFINGVLDAVRVVIRTSGDGQKRPNSLETKDVGGGEVERAEHDTLTKT
ncbi:MAG: transcription antitermination factor NusB [Desulfobulbaceae bacterium]